MQDTLTQSDTDWLTLIDFESETACEAGIGGTMEDCDNPAEWRITVSCCGKSLLVCDYHNQQNINWTEAADRLNATIECLFCYTLMGAKEHILSRIKI